MKLRTIREDRTFADAAAVLRTDVERLDEQLEGVMWTIARDPESCHNIPRTRLRIIKTDPFPGAPALRIYFTVDDGDTCTLCYIEPQPDDED